ncbi:helix-turn-helix domain-containing protein [Streptomyces sp. NPDC002913]
MDTLELLAHPVRLRVVHALRGGRALTTGQLCTLIPDASKATVYRHVDLLAAGGILDVADERRVRGAVERSYRLRQEHPGIDAETMRALTPQHHERAFAAAMASLVAEFGAYLEHEGSDPVDDLVGYRQHAIWLSKDELVTLIGAMQAANEPSRERTRYLLSPVLFPAEQAGQTEQAEQQDRL